MEDIIIIEESSVTARGYRHRTTIPRRVFQFLKLRDKDKLRWVVLKDGTVIVRHATRLSQGVPTREEPPVSAPRRASARARRPSQPRRQRTPSDNSRT